MDAVAFVRELQAAANAHDARKLAGFYSEDAVAVSPVFGRMTGREAVARSFERLFETFPDSVYDLSEVFTEGDRLAFLGTVAATDRNGWFGLPPTGAAVRYRLTVVCTLAGGKIIREERLYDLSGIVERLEKARIEAELRTASEVQKSLLPRTVRAGVRWEAAADSIPCRAIGGDFFEIVDLPSGAVGVALGDVEGKGAPAALVGAMLHGMLAAYARADLPPAATLRLINDHLTARDSGDEKLAIRRGASRYTTIVYGVLAPDGRFVYSNAGHASPVHLSRGEARRLRPGGPILGAFADPSFEDGVVRLEAGDVLLLFSDGVTEARNARDEEFGERRLLSRLSEGTDRPPQVMLDSLLGAVRDFVGPTPQADDITILVARFR